MLNLPEAFGSAYVGETFSCTLCANNELDPADTTRAISGVKIQGEMQTPSTPAGSPLQLDGAEDEEEGSTSPGPGESLQKILRFELKEEGNHVLAVTVTYTETALAGEGKATSGRTRTFRKLYQFVAQQLLSVRTKTGELSDKDGQSRFLLEAQLENMGEGAVSFEVRYLPYLSAIVYYTTLGAPRVFHQPQTPGQCCTSPLPTGVWCTRLVDPARRDGDLRRRKLMQQLDAAEATPTP